MLTFALGVVAALYAIGTIFHFLMVFGLSYGRPDKFGWSLIFLWPGFYLWALVGRLRGSK